MIRHARFGQSLLFLFALLTSVASPVMAGEFCSAPPFNGVVDGFVDYSTTVPALSSFPTQITIDTDCTFQNFTASNPLKATINFQTNDPSIYLITFDNVVFTGNMACSNIDHSLWFVNGSDYGSGNNCQDLFIPAETINKQNPARTTVGVGETFTYTLTLPYMQAPLGDPSPVDLINILVRDDLTTTGADLTLVSMSYSLDGGAPVAITNLGTNKLLEFNLPDIPSGSQIVVSITVSVDDTANNIAGASFVNTARWWFTRWIDINGDLIPQASEYFYLPGESGVTAPMTIGEPNLVLSKTADQTTLNFGIFATFTIDVQNNGGSDAWNATIIDQLPDSVDAGLCDYDPTTGPITAQIFTAAGTPATGALVQGIHYTVSYDTPSCQLTFNMLTSISRIQPTQYLRLTFQTQLDASTTADPFPLSNVAAATRWYSANPGAGYPVTTYSRTLTDGTPGVIDHEDEFTVSTTLTGYYFQKTVSNVTTGVDPATTASPGDRVRYRLRLFNLDQTFTNITIEDVLDLTEFDINSFTLISLDSLTFDPPTVFNGGTLTFTGITGFPLNSGPNSELIFEFEINLLSSLVNNDVVTNQASLTADGAVFFTSDNPQVNGIAPPGGATDSTDLLIQAPGPLSKANNQTSATIGEQFTYTITVPAATVNIPLYDVRILDDLTSASADMRFVSANVLSGGSWSLSNGGTSTSLIIQDTATGIDIPANGQAVIEITVELQNTSTNQGGVLFSNSASYTYNRSNGVSSTEQTGAAGSTTDMTIVEPNIVSITKLVDNLTPTAGDTIRYSVTLTASSGANYSDVFDVALTDMLDLGLVYAGNPTVTAGAGVSADNSIGAPDIIGDGIVTPQTLDWSLNSNVSADMDIVAGSSITIAYDVRVLDSVLANQTLSNNAIAQWSSIDDAASGERDGVDGVGGLNDYQTAAATVAVTTPDIVTTIIKTRSNDTYGAADADVRIGDLVEYTLTVPVPEGTLGNLQLVDTLPQGLDFDSIVSINGNTGPAPYTAVAPFSHSDITAASVVEAGDPVTGATTVSWTLGNVHNQPNDGLSDNFVIVYRARVLNTVFAHSNLSIALNNTVAMSYDTASGTVAASDIDTIITALQPELVVSKSAVAAGGDSIIDPGEVVTYTVDIDNSTGTAPAYDVVLEDIIPSGMRVAGITPVSTYLLSAGPVPGLTSLAPAYDAVTGVAIWNFDSGVADAYTIPAGDTLRIVYQVQADAGIGSGLTLTNQAQVSAYYSFDDEAVPTLGSLTGTRETYGPSNTATATLYTGSLPTKALLSSAQASIGDEVLYQITVPGTASTSGLYDIQVTDTLNANLELISATVTGGIGVTDTSTGSQLNLAISEIPAGQQVVIELRTRVANSVSAQQGVTMDNTVAYTYAYSPGGTTQPTLTSVDSVTVTIVEPQIVLTKAVTAITPAPVTGGDVLEYVLTLANTNAPAYDVTIVDTLPAGLQLDSSFTPTATIAGVPVVGFVASPDGGPGGPLIWGEGKGDGSLDIPAGSSLVLTYRVFIDETVESNVTLSNSVQVDWSSMNGSNAGERSGAGCPGVTAPNDYCSGPATASVTTTDTNSLTKSVISDSWIPAADATLRVGDTVTYRLELALQEGLTRNVSISDVLPAGLVFDSMVRINGDTTADYTPPASGAGSNYSYATLTAASVPGAGDSGTLNWTFGNVTNDPLGDATTDILVIEYTARVIENNAATIAQAASTGLNNTATLSYLDGTGAAVIDPARLASTGSITVLQPVLTTPVKIDRLGRTSPLTVDIATDIMQFRVSSCNSSGLAPAYNVQITDNLPAELDETSITGLTVSVGVAPALTTLAAGEYTYTPPVTRGGDMLFAFSRPLDPGQCFYIDYNIGFHTDISANQTWSNTATVDRYYAIDGQLGQLYPALGPVIYTMSNTSVIEPPAKAIVSPLTGEASIGDEIVYRITVPQNPKNAAMFDVSVIDNLAAELIYVDATDVSGNGFVLTDNSVLPGQVNLGIAQIPAGQQAVIELRTRVDNTASSNAGSSFTNTARYTFADTAGGGQNDGGTSPATAAISIVEPLVTLGKAVINSSNPGQPPTAGDILRYSLTLNASGGVGADNFSDAFDISIEDSLSPGLVYSGNPAVTGAGNTIGVPVISGDGSTATPQTLNWNLTAGNADIDISEGTSITITYDVVVLDTVLAGQTLTNSAVALWTSIAGINANERNGSGTPAVNDYLTTPATTTLTTPVTNTLSKSILNETFGTMDGTVRIGDVIDFELRLNLQEGISPAVSLVDTLPQGLIFEGIVSINTDTAAPFTSVAPFSHADIATPTVTGNPATGPTIVTWAIGDITNAGDNNPANNDFVIVYRARVLNQALAQVNSTTLTNSVDFSYTLATGTTTLTASTSMTVLQPALSVTRSAAPAGGDSVIDASEIITYTVDITNSGAVAAYDTIVTDIIPIGLRSGTATITMVSTSLVVAGTVLPNMAPAYNAATGVATWNFDSGIANQYNIRAGDTLRLVYQLQADTTLSAGMTLTNQAQVQAYYSFDDDATPVLGSVSGVAEVFAPSNIASTTLTTAAPNPLNKQNPVTGTGSTGTVAVGDSFSYQITVPATPMTTALNDVRIIDNLGASAADLSFVSVSVSGSYPWTAVNTGTAISLVIEDPNIGIDIPAGQQIVFSVTVLVNDSPTNVSGLLFDNSATYTYNQVNDDVSTRVNGSGNTTATLTITGPDSITLQKSGPTQMIPNIPSQFSLDLHNTGTGTAWDLTVTDVLPDPAPGGMCDTPPVVTSAQIFLADGTTLVTDLQASDYVVNYLPAPDCILSITMLTANGALPADHRLIINYEALLDVDNPQGTVLTNVAAVTEWFSGDTAGAGATGQIRTYTRSLTDGTTATLDHEDAHSVTALSPIIQFQKTVENITTGQNPATTATPGDVLRYRLVMQNVSVVALTNFVLTDEVDRLNPSAMFAAGSLAVVNDAGGDSSNTNSAGGAQGTGLLDIRGLTLDAAGGANDTLIVEFDVTLAAVITNGTVVLNQAQINSIVTGTLDSDEPVINGVDDPNIQGDEDATPVTITSAPLLVAEKRSFDLTGDPAILEPGDTLRYSITVSNSGTEDAINVQLSDLLPANTTYVANTTQLNGNAVTDPTAGISALQAGMLINGADNTTAGYIRADVNPAAAATITFDVVVNTSVINGTVISNQGVVNGEGQGSGPFSQLVTDNPDTATVDDPTVDIVGSLPLIDAQKTVSIINDGGTPGIVDPGDRLAYTISINNYGNTAATGVRFTDATPAFTSYVAGSVTLNGEPVSDLAGGVSPLIAGIDVSSSDLTLPLPAAGAGVLTPGQSAVITFEVDVTGVTGDIISNQGFVYSNEQAVEPTDFDGIDSNGDQATDIIIGNAQLLSITKEVFVVNGGAALAGSRLEYRVRVSNISSVPANSVVIVDDLDNPVANQMTYVPGSATLNGLTTGISYTPAIISADYSTSYGDLQPGETITLRFLADLDAGLITGTTITNTARVDWNAATQNASASVSIDVGGIPGVASLNGIAWHDANFDNIPDSSEALLAGWSIDFYRNGTLLDTVVTDTNGRYQIIGLAPNDLSLDPYEIRFRAPGATTDTALLGYADSIFTNGLQRISDIIVPSGSNRQNLNLSINPDGVVYNSVTRTPVAGARLTMVNATTGALLPVGCFDNLDNSLPQQQQVTQADGHYRFDINFSDPACPAGGDYVINISAPATGYTSAPSIAIPAMTDVTTAAYSVPLCSADAIVSTSHCEAQASALAPAASISAPGPETSYYLKLTLNNGAIPQESQLFNNHIPIDPDLTNVVTISKTSPLVSARRGQMVPYTITANNTLTVPLPNMNIVDTYPAGFRYVKGSARIDGIALEPVDNGQTLTWGGVTLDPGSQRTIKLLLVVGSGVSEGEYINRAQIIDSLTLNPASPLATATVRVVPDPVFDCTDIIGKVFDDKNMNGYQDEGEKGIASARIVSARGLVMKTDAYGRFHISCAAVPNQDRGSNFILKLDERSLPSGYRVISENPRVQRATRGKMMKFNFAATIHRVIRLDLADPVFENNTDEIRLQWLPRLNLLVEELNKGAAILRIAYLADIEETGLVNDRIDIIKQEIQKLIEQKECCSALTIESEIFWRRGGPPTRGSID